MSIACIDYLLHTNENCRAYIETNEMHASCAPMNNNEQYDNPKQFLEL